MHKNYAFEHHKTKTQLIICKLAKTHNFVNMSII